MTDHAPHNSAAPNLFRRLQHLWYHESYRGYAVQTVLVLAVLWAIFSVVQNVTENLDRQQIASGFGFLDTTSGFVISQRLVDYSETSSYGRALYVGFVNTLAVAIVGIFLSTVLGFAIGISRLSSNWLLSRIATSYIELLRNIPLLLQIFFVYFGVLRTLPFPQEAYALGDLIFLDNRGLHFPILVWGADGFGWSVPELGQFNFVGGAHLSPEYLSLLLALTLYTAAFIAEIVRAGIQSVPAGQIEAARSLGLGNTQIMRFVTLPQALRVIIPPLTSQYLNLTKNSSLAVFIAYPELVSISGITLNQTGQAIEVLSIAMIVYLTLSLLTSLAMNVYYSRTQFAGRSA